MTARKFKLSPLRIASFVFIGLMILSTLYLSWFDFSGLTLNVFDLFGGFSLILLAGVLLFFASIFLANQKLSGALKLIAGLIELLIWTAILFLVMMPLSQFMPSVSSLLGYGFWLFPISVAAIVVIGLIEWLGQDKKRKQILAPATILRLTSSALLVAVLFSTLLFPQKVEAWGAVENKTMWSSSAMTHQEILKVAYEQLKENEAIADQLGRFPEVDDILKNEGVLLPGTGSVLIWGPQGIGGPDAETSGSKASEHYFNPNLKLPEGAVASTASDIPSTIEGTGGAPTAVGKYFLNLLDQMYLPNQVLDKSKQSQGAAWASHFLADIQMPYHTIGVPAEWISDSDTPIAEQSGGMAFWNPLKIKYEDDQPVLDSIPKPTFGWGGKDDFGSAIVDFKQYQKLENTKQRDWFDPWYMNGGTKSAPSISKTLLDSVKLFRGKNWLIQIATSSHGGWEAWAAQKAQGTKPGLKSGSSVKWTNGTPSLDLSVHLANQAKQAEAFTIAAAKETQNNRMTWLKQPEIAVSSAIEKTTTLWRASMSALRPTLNISPSPTASNRLLVVVTFRNTEPNDSAKNVQARLNITGGKLVLGSDEIKKLGNELNSKDGQSRALTWEVETPNPQNCTIKVEAICNYENTPDLQYAVAEPNQNRMTVQATPGSVKAGDKVTLTVKVQPAGKTQLTITEWGPLNKGASEVTTDSEGVFTKEYSVSKTAKDKMYTVRIRAPKLDLTGSASIGVGLNIKNSRGIYIRFAEGVKPIFSYSNRPAPTPGFIQLGDNPDTTIISWDGEYVVNATMVGNAGETGKLKVTLDSNYETITSFVWEYNYQNPQDGLYGLKTMSMTITGGGLKKGSIESVFNTTPDFYYKLTGEEVGRKLNIKISQTFADGTKAESNQIIGSPDAICDFLFQR